MFGHPYILQFTVKSPDRFPQRISDQHGPGGPALGYRKTFSVEWVAAKKTLARRPSNMFRPHFFWHKVDMRGQHPVAFKSCLLASGLVKSKHLVYQGNT